MLITGTIIKINTDLKYGFIEVPTIGDVFFCMDTTFSNITFHQLQVGIKINVKIKETKRGFFAESLSVINHRERLNRQISQEISP